MNKICTSVEQSQKLIELGIDISTADMCWSIFNTSWGERIYTIVAYPMLTNQGKGTEKLEYIPAWSLAALLSIIPKYIGDSVFRMDMGETDTILWFDDLSSGTVDENLPDITEEYFVDAAFEMILKLKEKDLL